MKMLGECEMVLYCHLGCNGNNSGPLKSTFGTIFIHSFRTMTIIAFDMNLLRTYLWCKTKKCFLFLNLGGLLLKTKMANFSWIRLEAKSASGGQKVDRFVTAGEVAEMGAASMKRYT